MMMYICLIEIIPVLLERGFVQVKGVLLRGWFRDIFEKEVSIHNIAKSIEKSSYVQNIEKVSEI